MIADELERCLAQLRESNGLILDISMGFARKRNGIIGSAIYNEAKILIDNESEHAVEAVRHEVAHIAAFESNGVTGHGKIWKQFASQLGCEHLTGEISWHRAP